MEKKGGEIKKEGMLGKGVGDSLTNCLLVEIIYLVSLTTA